LESSVFLLVGRALGLLASEEENGKWTHLLGRRAEGAKAAWMLAIRGDLLSQCPGLKLTIPPLPAQKYVQLHSHELRNEMNPSAFTVFFRYE